MDNLPTHKSLEIVSAEVEGFFVAPTDSARGEYRGVLFAGPLDDCLNFMGRTLSRRQSPEA